ncbi:MAG: hypothetical protein IKT52_10680 [Oscillospiraceae bacterium]|nr:hypothetical protein [Oscillospiraceae bacterium]
MKSKFWSLLLSVLVAAGLWLYVITTVSPGSKTTIENIPVVFESETWLLENRNLMITDGMDTTVDLAVSGNRSDLNKLNSSNITLKVDLTKVYEAGTAYLSYTPAYPPDVPSGAITVESRNPASVKLTVEKRLTKEIPVKVAFAGAVPEGFIADTENIVLDYPAVNIKGPASVVEQIEEARIDINLEDRTESLSESYRYTLCDREGNPVDVEMITTDVAEVHLDVKIQRYQEVPLRLNVIYGGGATEGYTRYELKPSSIRVSGSEAVLDDLKEIVLGTVNFAEQTENTQMTFPINLPEGVTNLTGITEATADIRFVGLSIKEFTTENITVINVPEGLTCELMSEVVKVTLRGPTAKINQTKPEDIVVTVDLTGKEVGATTVKAVLTIRSDTEGMIGAVGTPTVSVTLKEAEAT